MSKEENKSKSILSAGAAAAFTGLTLYALGKTLSFLFRDVDPDRAEKEEDTDSENEEI